MGGFWQDMRYGLRKLRRSPAFALTAILTLALGVGPCTAIFSVVDGVLLRPLPYPNHARLLRVEELHPGSDVANFTYATFLDLARQSKTVDAAAAFRPWLFNLTGQGQPEQVAGALVSGDFFHALGARPLLGRAIGPADDQQGGDTRVVVLGYTLWQSRYGADAGILGKSIDVSGSPCSVIGVMPAGFEFPQQARLWQPLVPGGNLRDNHRAHLLTVIADLKAGESIGRVGEELAALAEMVERQNPDVDPNMTLTAVPLKSSLTAPVRPALELLICAVGLLLLVSCANLANLFLARASSRRKEIALRLAVGAGQGRLARQLLTEAALVGFAGGALGFLIAAWSLDSIIALSSRSLPQVAAIGIDWRAFSFALAVSLAAGLASGLALVWGGEKLDVNASLKAGADDSTGVARRLSGRMLVGVQFTLAMVLLAGAGLLANSFARLLRADPGFNVARLLTMGLFLSPTEYSEGDPKVAVALGQMIERIRAVPGVRAAAVANALPITGGPDTDFAIVGRPLPPSGGEPEANIVSVDPGYFAAMQIPLIAGRDFIDGDTARSGRVMVINQTLAREFWPDESPLGQSVTMKDWGRPLTGRIVGVVGDVKANGLDTATRPMIYWPYTQFPVIFNSIVVRTGGDPLRLAPALEAAIWSVDRNQPIASVATMDQILSESLAQRRLYLVLLGVFASAALLLAAVGVYGLLSYAVSRRTRDIGIRVALGAQRVDVLLLILGQGTKPALFGVVVGTVLGLGATRWIAGLLFGVSATDAWTFGGAAILLAAVAIAACCGPAWRAMRVAPAWALRNE